MEKISPETWSVLETNLPTGEKLTAKPAIPDISSQVFCALDSEKRRTFWYRSNPGIWHMLTIRAEEFKS